MSSWVKSGDYQPTRWRLLVANRSNRSGTISEPELVATISNVLYALKPKPRTFSEDYLARRDVLFDPCLRIYEVYVLQGERRYIAKTRPPRHRTRHAT